ncbi:MAG TPA: NUDIX domain-containing protein [Firmicutes bacterium]|nr:NUDIX domain-containing protein [Bacillota bacterium]
MAKYYYMDSLAPLPTCLHIGTATAIFHRGRVLLDHRRDGDWGLIGGAMELGESLEECARREIWEETGLKVGALRLLGLFSHPTRIIAYEEGDILQSITVCFAAEASSEVITLSAESREARFFSEADLAVVPVVATHRMIIPHLFHPEDWPVIQ